MVDVSQTREKCEKFLSPLLFLSLLALPVVWNESPLPHKTSDFKKVNVAVRSGFVIDAFEDVLALSLAINFWNLYKRILYCCYL